jgi:Zn-dependent protease
MLPTRKGSIRLFRFAGVQVYLHWSWFALVAYEVSLRSGNYSSGVFNVLEYLALFGIVLLHEFGHALACRQVGGQADQIVLWPLGGVAYVAPPQRPGAMLWSIAAGPLVNVGLLPVLGGAWFAVGAMGWDITQPDWYALIQMVAIINLVLLIFNLLPVYPLDGGQILRSLLWFVFGRARSLMIAASIGVVGVVGLIGLAIWLRSVWTVIMGVFILMNCVGGLRQARMLAAVAKLPRRGGFACPSCGMAPPIGIFWRCGQCRNPLDTFEAGGVCPHCGTQFPVTACPDCGVARPMSEWVVGGAAPPKLRT